MSQPSEPRQSILSATSDRRLLLADDGFLGSRSKALYDWRLTVGRLALGLLWVVLTIELTLLSLVVIGQPSKRSASNGNVTQAPMYANPITADGSHDVTVTMETASSPASTGTAHWVPSPLTPPEFSAGLLLVISNMSPVVYIQSAPAFPPISLPDLPLSLVTDLNTLQAPLRVSDTVQTSARIVDGLRAQVALHLPSDLAQEVLYEAQSAVLSAGLEVISTSASSFGIAKSEVRYFHQEDASEAARLAELIDAEVRDFSAYRPMPPPGGLEVWLAQGAE